MSARPRQLRRMFFGMPLLLVILTGMLFSPLAVNAQPAMPPSTPPQGAQEIRECPYVITSPGAYVLAQDVACFGFRFVAITIASDDVVLWLKGHTLTGGSRNALTSGIASFRHSRIAIVGPGTISGWRTGIDFTEVHEVVVACATSAFNRQGLVLAGYLPTADVINPSTNNVIIGSVFAGNFSGISVTFSNNNVLTLNTAVDNLRMGISLGAGATSNAILGNSAHRNGILDLDDDNPGCDSNIWRNNLFGTANQPCIH